MAKVKTEIEWVTGENPVTESIKLVAVWHPNEGSRTVEGYFAVTTSIWYYHSNNFPIEVGQNKVIAWAAPPIFDGTPIEDPKLSYQAPSVREELDHNHVHIARLIQVVSDLSVDMSRIIGRDLDTARPHEIPSINEKCNKLTNVSKYLLTGNRPL